VTRSFHASLTSLPPDEPAIPWFEGCSGCGALPFVAGALGSPSDRGGDNRRLTYVVVFGPIITGTECS
jgi:hypothetical protein